MKIRKFNENLEMYSECQDYLSAAISAMKEGNPENLTPLVNLASTIDNYYVNADRAIAMEPGWYSDKTVAIFKELVTSMLIDEESNTYHNEN